MKTNPVNTTPLSRAISEQQTTEIRRGNGFLSSINLIKNIREVFHILSAKLGLNKAKSAESEHLNRNTRNHIVHVSPLGSSHNVSKIDEISFPQKTPMQICLDQATIFPAYRANIRRIDAQMNFSDTERKLHYQLNTLDRAIRLHPNFYKEEGIFRTSGKKEDTQLIFVHLDSGQLITEEFIKKNNISLASISLAYKELIGRIAQEQNYVNHFVKYSPDEHLQDAIQNQSKIESFIEQNSITGDKRDKILANTKKRIEREAPQLALDMLTTLFADISKNPATRMGPENLAICLAPRLQTDISNKFSLDMNKRLINYLKTLTQAKL